MAAIDQPVQKESLFAQIKSYNKTFWLANLMEMLERWGYYGVRLVLALYIVGAVNQGGLEFTHIQKGAIYLWWAVISSFLPMFTGGFSDRYGYKKTIGVSIALKVLGYALMATQHSYAGFFAGCMVLAAGTGLFKPGVQGLLAHNVTEKTASVGWGLFYQLVNIGAFIAGLMATPLREHSWGAVFWFNTALVALNFVPLFLFKEPDVKRPENNGGLVGVVKEGFGILVSSIKDMLEPRLLIFVLIFSGFWLSFNQLFDLLPNFIDDWTVASTLHPYFLMEGGAVAPEKILNLNSAMIIFFMVPIAYVASKFRALTAINVGILCSIVGILMAGLTQNGWMAVAGIIVFTLGEMLASPRTNDYMASIAPVEKKGAYLGYANVPVGIGWALGSIFAGNMYETNGDKVNFARAYLESHGMTAEAVKAIPKEKVMQTLADQLHMTIPQATEMLWNTHHPERIWAIFAAVAFVSLVGMAIYNAVVTRMDSKKAQWELTSTVPQKTAEPENSAV